MIEIEIDGKKFAVAPGSMIIEAADAAGIPIPRFCYHKKLSIAANCRMCLVDVEKSGKPLPACATPVTDGMVVHTQSAKAKEAQKAVMSFLLMNHPLDCPICDQAGQCELQDVSMAYGEDFSRYKEGKRSVQDKSLGSLVETEMTRCIHCTRCIRFTDEIAGFQELGTMGRGEMTEVGTYIQKGLVSELSGNIIDLCPVGALTSKPFRYTARAFELEQRPSIAPHDCIGSHINIHTRRGEVMRVVPREAEAINETWLADRDRFSYEALNSSERLLQPMIKEGGEWQVVDWFTALSKASESLKKVAKEVGGQQIGALIASTATTEEGFLLQKLLRGLGSSNIDYRVQQRDFRTSGESPQSIGLPMDLTALSQQDRIVLIGSEINREQPIVAHRLRQAFLQGAEISVLNPAHYTFRFEIVAHVAVKPSALPTQLAGWIHALINQGGVLPATLSLKEVQDFPIDENARVFAQSLLSGEKKLILLGALALNHQEASVIQRLAQIIAEMTGAQIGCLTPGPNAKGLAYAGAKPQAKTGEDKASLGLNAHEMLRAKLKAYLLFGVEPGLDSAFPALAHEALAGAETVIAITPFFCHKVASYADILLPSAAFSETAGTYVNAQNDWQSFQGAVPAKGDSRPGWKILRVLGNLLGLANFDYDSSEQVLGELRASFLGDKVEIGESLPLTWPPISKSFEGLELFTAWPIYRADSLVRRAPALQATAIAELPSLYLNPRTANRFQLSFDTLVSLSTATEAQSEWPITIVDYLPDDTLYIPGGFGLSAELKETMGPVTLQRSETL